MKEICFNCKESVGQVYASEGRYKPRCYPNYCDLHKGGKFLRWSCGEAYSKKKRREKFIKDKVKCPLCDELKSRYAKMCRQCVIKKQKTGEIVLGRPFRRGKEHPRWSEGRIRKIRDVIENSKKYKRWRSDVFERDNWTCQTCGIRGGRLQAHHIKSMAKILKEHNILNYNDVKEGLRCKELFDVNNGVTLCIPCHYLTDNYGGKKQK